MKKIVIPRSGGPEVLRIEEAPDLAPGPGELLIRARASGVNFADILARQGIYPDCPPYPCVVGYEVAGVVEAAGSGVDASWKGRSVMALTNFGGYADLAKVDLGHVWEKPAALSFEQAAAIPLNYITAWGLLAAMGGLARGDTVLIHNAGSGVGLAAIDVAKHLGASVIGTASSRKHEFLRSRGVDHTVDYTRDDWQAQVMQRTNGRGVELAIDPIGGGNWKKTYAVLRKTGRMGMFGISSASGRGIGAKLGLLKVFASAPFFHPAKLIPGNRGVYGINIHNMYEETGKLTAWMTEILKGVAAGWARPHVDKAFPAARVGEAHAHVENRGNIGKVILTW